MKAMILPSDDPRVWEVCKVLRDRGHAAVCVYSQAEFLTEFTLCDLVVAMGQLNPLGTWLWGYCYAKRKPVRAISGVSPCPVSRTVRLETWLEKIPEQLSLFPGETHEV